VIASSEKIRFIRDFDSRDHTDSGTNEIVFCWSLLRSMRRGEREKLAKLDLKVRSQRRPKRSTYRSSRVCNKFNKSSDKLIIDGQRLRSSFLTSSSYNFAIWLIVWLVRCVCWLIWPKAETIETTTSISYSDRSSIINNKRRERLTLLIKLLVNKFLLNS
jgi:hypothetical protein